MIVRNIHIIISLLNHDIKVQPDEHVHGILPAAADTLRRTIGVGWVLDDGHEWLRRSLFAHVLVQLLAIWTRPTVDATAIDAPGTGVHSVRTPSPAGVLLRAK